MLRETSVGLLGFVMSALASCGGDKGSDGAPMASTATSTPRATATPRSARPATPGVGEGYRVGGQVVVTLTRVIDPLPLASYEGTKHYVAIKLAVNNHGTGT